MSVLGPSCPRKLPEASHLETHPSCHRSWGPPGGDRKLDVHGKLTSKLKAGDKFSD